MASCVCPKTSNGTTSVAVFTLSERASCWEALSWAAILLCISALGALDCSRLTF